MKRAELASLLDREGFRENSYSLTESESDEALCLRYDQGHWYVFYAERGLQTGKTKFGSEEDACHYFLKVMRADPTTRKSWHSGFSMPKGSHGNG